MADRRGGSSSPIKTFFQILQCLHHLANLLADQGGAGSSPKAFSRKQKELNYYIRPAIPNSTILKVIRGASSDWATTVTQGLITHYRTEIEVLKGSLSAWRISQAEKVLYRNKALEWARRNFGKKLRKSSLENWDHILNTFCAPSIKKPQNSNQGNASGNTQQVAVERRACPVSESGRGEGGHSTPQKRKRTSFSPTQSHPPKRAITPQKPLQNRTAPKPMKPPSPTTAQPSYARVARSPPNSTIRQSPPCRNLFNTHPSVQRFGRLGREQRGNKIHEAWEIPRVMKPVLILGDSNLSRVTEVKRHEAQIVSYPGLKLDHLLKLLQGFKHGSDSQNPSLKPRKVVFVVGVNDRGLSSATNSFNLKKVVNEAGKVFPGSKIMVLQNQFSDTLDREEKNTLRKLNEDITFLSNKKDVAFIPPLDRNKFEIGWHDNIHWTERCANRTIDHIFRFLN